MNLFRNIIAIGLSLGLVLGSTSCAVHHHHHTRVIKHDNGKHLGWYKGKKGNPNPGSKGNNGNHGRGKGNKHK
ncbi:MAG: hypothetical protein ACO1O6_10745 [Bacteroidota bacterium]